MIEKHLSEKIVSACQRLHQQGFLAAADGNISIRTKENCVLITPSGISKAFMNPEEMCLITLKGGVLHGTPSSESLMHLAVYNAVPDAVCVVHAHPPTAIAWSIAKPTLTHLPIDSLSEAILAAGSIPIVPYARPGTAAMGSNLIPFLPSHRLMILARHGALAWGENLDEAIGGIERLEHTAKILLAAEQLGGITSLPEQDITELKKLRQKLGSKLL